MTLLAVAIVAALVAAAWLSRPAPVVPRDLVEAPAGVGDPYFPGDGGGGYDAQRYAVDLTWDAAERTLTGTTTVRAVATQDLDTLHLDLWLPVRSVSAAGKPAQWRQQADDLAITLPRSQSDRVAVSAGTPFEVTIGYSGSPEDVQLGDSPSFYRAGDEILIGGEPHAAALWFPVNDAPRDPAGYDLVLHVPKGTEAISAGEFVATDTTDPGHDTWTWRIDDPTVSYATFLAIGQFEVSTGTADGRRYFYAVSKRLSADQQTKAMTWLRGTPAAIRKLERYLGPYPIRPMGGFVPGVPFFWGGLECLGRPIYHNGLVGRDFLLQHELAHMWVGDTVTLAEWNDIYDNEALASYAEWLTSTESRPDSAARQVYAVPEPDFWADRLSDPGISAMFGPVYSRGPLSLHALRTRMGDEAFFAFLKSWAQQRGPHSLEQFRQLADDATPEDLSGFFARWLDGTKRPAQTAENGLK